MAETIRGWFRRVYGYDTQNRCKDCKYIVLHQANRRYYKCEKMRETHSKATDIRLKDYACSLFERSEDGVETETEY